MTNHDLYDICLIIPFLNERENLRRLCPELEKFASEHHDIRFEIIFVDDGSIDGSFELLAQLSHKYYEAQLIKLSRNFGSQSAIRAGILHSHAEYTTFISADLQEPLDLVMRLYQKCHEGFDIVYAVRNQVEGGVGERMFSKLFALLMRYTGVRNFPKNGLDSIMFNDKVAQELNANIEANSCIGPHILSLGFQQASILFDKKARAFGKSKWTISKKLKLFIDSFIAFSYLPIRLVSVTGIALTLIGLLWIVYLILRAVLFGDLAAGWPMLISILIMGFGVTNISLGILAEYQWRTLDAARKRPVFIIDKIVELGKGV
jgi:glycosyltransferase involved in cell wall biosynthesis